MILSLLFSITLFQDTYFADARVYEPSTNSFQTGIHLLLDDKGRVKIMAKNSLQATDSKVVRGATIVPHYSDFYSLIQERGLGNDKDIDEEAQRHMGSYLMKVGMGTLRDPVFPPAGVGVTLADNLAIYASRGYLDLPHGPGEEISILLNPNEPVAEAFSALPAQGPITLWWTSYGSDTPLEWPRHDTFLKALIKAAHQREQNIGIYIQDATQLQVALAARYDFDFYEGMPKEMILESVPEKVIWVPLASLNDRRYCASNFAESMERAGKLGLYSQEAVDQALRANDSVRERIAERCGVWRSRRDVVLDMVKNWLKADRPIGLGSGGGHMFAFTGDLRSELRLFAELQASDQQLLKSLFQTTPKLLKVKSPYLKPGKKANFIVYAHQNDWLDSVGSAVSHNYRDGKNILDLGDLLQTPQIGTQK